MFCALVLFIILGLEPTLERFAILFKKDLISTEGRWTIWADTLKMITDFPLFGTGLGTFKNIYPMYRTLSVQATVSYAHSDFIQLVSECGLLGLGLSVWFLAMFFKDVFSLWLNRHNIFVKGITLGCLTGCLAILLHSFFDFSLQIPAIAFLFAIILALSYKCVLLRDDD
ncbi:MAG: O-antigen ligase family protein [Candidatus Omnitrophica bacterium]|nr:O-antigen ligase family protein [Candidatus Omnitrophota bacterium]